jgi:tetratricopeptide (TPR) repeat protein
MSQPNLPGSDPGIALENLLKTRTPEGALHCLAEHPELLSDAAESLLTDLEARASEEGDAEAARRFAWLRALLQRCREIGPLEAFAERVSGVRSPAPPAPEVLDERHRALQALDHYDRTGERTALDEAVVAWDRIETNPEFGRLPLVFRLSTLNSAAVSRLWRYLTLGEAADLNAGLALWQSAVAESPDRWPDLPLYLNNLGNTFRYRYTAHGRPEDLDEAVRLYQRSVDACDGPSPRRAGFLANQGIGLFDRYLLVGREDDLSAAVRADERVVTEADPDDPRLHGFLSNLGNALRERAVRSGTPVDRDRAIQYLEDALDRRPPSGPDRPNILTNLGMALRLRRARRGHGADLDWAVRVHEEAVARLPAGAPDPTPTCTSRLPPTRATADPA